MEQLIEILLSESGYLKKDLGISVYSKQDQSFFFTISILEENFIALKSKELLKENQAYKAVLDGFKLIVNSGEQVSIEKNSSLIVLVKCTEINAIAKLQQQILLFEEDEYFFKKYVILYTNNSITGLTNTPLLPELRMRVNDVEKFDAFAAQGYTPELSEFLVIVQLFIKLPFLNFGHGTESFTSLNQKITTDLGASYTTFTYLLQNAEELTRIDFTKPEAEERINELLSNLPND